MKDARRAPFCYQTLAAVRAIQKRFRNHPRQLTVALAIYLALTFEANEQRCRDGFRASRAKIAKLAGTSDRTLDRYAAIFERLGLLEVARQREGEDGMNLPNVWTLIEQSGGEAASPPAKQARHGGERASPGVAKPTAPISKKQTQEVEEGGPPPSNLRTLHPRRSYNQVMR